MILFLTRKYPPSIGGMQRFSYGLANHLSRVADVRLISWGRSQAFLPLFLPIATLLSFYSVWKTEETSIVYLADPVLSPVGALLKGLFALSAVVTVHGRDIVFSNRLYQHLLPKFLSRMDRIICVSEEIKRECLKRGLAEELCVVVPNGIEVEHFETAIRSDDIRTLERSAGTRLRDKRVLLTVGRLVAKKGIPYFVGDVLPRVLEKRRDLCYLIVGDGPQRGSIIDLVKQKGLQDYVCLLGSMPMDSRELVTVYALADIFVMPNVPTEGDLEGFGIVILEAWAAGTCVVASAVDGIKNLVHDGEDGLLIDPHDADGFAAGILKLLDDDALGQKLRSAAKRRVNSEHSWGAVARMYADVFDRLTRESQSIR